MHHSGDNGGTVGTGALSRDATDLPEAVPRQDAVLDHDDSFELRIGAVLKRIGDASVRMLAYNGSIPGPTLRVKQGSEIVVHVTNAGDVDATVHWHGLRLENRYDGVPHDTQKPIPVGGRFTYRVRFRTRVCTGTTHTSVRTPPRIWACTGTSSSNRPIRTTGRSSIARSS